MSDITRLRISREIEESVYQGYIVGKHILDIGTRSGENAIMMLKNMRAASVTAIDIISSEFPKDTQGVKFVNVSIQEFAKNNTMKYDVVTIFLWNIQLAQYDSCMDAINSILKPDGHIIVGIADDVYFQPGNELISLNNLFNKNKYNNYVIYHGRKINKYIVYANRM